MINLDRFLCTSIIFQEKVFVKNMIKVVIFLQFPPLIFPDKMKGVLEVTICFVQQNVNLTFPLTKLYTLSALC